VVGIDPSGRRLVLAAAGAGSAVPAVSVPLQAEREPQRFEEAEGVLRDFVTRHRLAGCEARLCIPVSRLHAAPALFPPLRGEDLRGAVGMELDRLFPVPAQALRFAFRPLGKDGVRKGTWLYVAASPSAFLEQWRECALRAGLRLSAAVPSPWAVAAALSEARLREKDRPVALLRDAGGDVECLLLRGREPLFAALRPGVSPASLSEALSALASGRSALPAALLPPPPGDGEGALLLRVPTRWEEALDGAGEERAFRTDGGFERRLGAALPPLGEEGEGPSPFDLLGAWGAAVAGKGTDLLSPGAGGGAGRFFRGATVAAALAAALLGAAWPAVVAWRTGREAAALEAEAASLRPAVGKVAEELAALSAVEARIAVLLDAGRGRDEALLVLGELTDRLPQGTWLTGFRLEGRKVEIDGYSAAANELFPLLTREDRFRKVEFASPITRGGDNFERFQIRAEYSPPAVREGSAQ
jgi:hypothetical protein